MTVLLLLGRCWCRRACVSTWSRAVYNGSCLRDSSDAACGYYYCTHTHPFNGPFSETTQVSQYQKGKTNLDFTEARDSGWQWHQLGHMKVCISLQTDNHASTPPLSFLQAGCPSCRPTNSVKALKAKATVTVAACCCCLDAGVGGSAPVRGAGLCTTGAV